ncbi:alanine racemase [candidate division Kazan bacterium]|uniref:Alanine racemase n=1 Tax=candidate division Kazan bacterium TaxID=2202143 RepID=A0A420ZDV4_UNCK3|nr:MAG: alanine racemase [candidate division Kazan bacterium]
MSGSLIAISVDLKAIDHNIKQVRRLLKPETRIMAVVKANAYGHGILEVARQALKSGAAYLGVVSAQEALWLRKKGILRPIVVLGAVAKEDIKSLIKEKVAMAVYNQESYRMISRTAFILNKRAIIWLKIETGINRLGFSIDGNNNGVIKIVKRIAAKSRYLQLEGIYSHLASVEELNKSYTSDQILTFERILKKIEDLGVKIPIASLAASAAASCLPESRFNCVRIGIEMYGLWPSRGVELWCKRSKKTRNFKLKPALSYKTKLVQVKRVKTGDFIGYGCSFQAPRAMTIGVIPVGYYEGLPRSLSNMGFALLKGAVVPIIGRICMNMTILDLSRRPRAKVGDEIVLIGKSKNKTITATDVADWANTINYEITTRIPEHIERVYKT